MIRLLAFPDLVLTFQGKYDVAEPYIEKAVAIFDQDDIPDTVDTAITLNVMSNLRMEQVIQEGMLVIMYLFRKRVVLV